MWFWLALIALLCWSGSDLFSKIGCRNGNEKYNHLKMVIAVGVVMGIHAAIEIFVQGVEINLHVIWTYLPVSLLYIGSMTLGYLGLQYIELSISSPICNASGALVAVTTLVTGQFDTEHKAILIAVILVVALLTLFLGTRLGLAIRATGNNPIMVKSSSINTVFTTIVGLCVANAFTGLSGCLLAQYQKSVNIDIGSGMVTIALASLLIGATILGRGKIVTRAVGVVLGSFIFRLVYTIALRFHLPAFMLKLVSSIIVVIALSFPYLKTQLPMMKRRLTHSKNNR